MDVSKLLDAATALGHRLAMCGAETYRVEDSINRVLSAYGVDSETFVIPNCMTVSIRTADGESLTRMRRIGPHGNDLDAVERYTGLSRRICSETPPPETIRVWLAETDASRRYYSLPLQLLGSALGAFGFAFLFGGSFADGLCACGCGLIIGLVTYWLEKLGANQFFRIIIAAFCMALPAYGMGALGLAPNPDAAIIGSLMILVPGLLFTNAMRDIIYGDTNSGINRVVQVLLIAVAIALGTAAAWSLAGSLWGIAPAASDIVYSYPVQAIVCFIGCLGFVVLFNIHGPGGLLCALGGVLTWLIYVLATRAFGNDLPGYFFATLFSSLYAESMARIRKYPAISYLVISIFPLIPGAGVYHTMLHAVKNNMGDFADLGMHTAAVAGIMAVAILVASTAVRILSLQRLKRVNKKS